MVKIQMIILICFIFLNFVKSEVKKPTDCGLNEYFVCEPWNCSGTCKCVTNFNGEIKNCPPPSCPVNSEFKLCRKKSQELCSGRSDDPNEQCEHGCSCKPGYCWSEHVERCVQKARQHEFVPRDKYSRLAGGWG